MKNKCLYSIAAFLIVLIISIPIYSSTTLAALYNPRLRGSDNIEGYAKGEDTIYVSVIASIEGDTQIEPSQVRLYGMPFHACFPLGGSSFNCQFMIASSSIAENPFQPTIVLYRDDGSVEDSIPISGAKDTIGPSILYFNSSPSIIGRGDISFNYSIEDRITNTSSGRCIGIKNIIITSGVYSRIINKRFYT